MDKNATSFIIISKRDLRRCLYRLSAALLLLTSCVYAHPLSTARAQATATPVFAIEAFCTDTYQNEFFIVNRSTFDATGAYTVTTMDGTVLAGNIPFALGPSGSISDTLIAQPDPAPSASNIMVTYVVDNITGQDAGTTTCYAPATATATDTPVPTDSPTNTATATDTPVPTDSPTNTPLPTNTATSTLTNTPLPTKTLQPTSTATSTPTNTPLPTNTATSTPTNTPLPTNTATRTATNTPLPTKTPQPTSTATSTSLPTSTATVTPMPTCNIMTSVTTTTPMQQLLVYGDGIMPNERFGIFWDTMQSRPLTTSVATARGTFAVTITVPQAVSGTHTVISADFKTFIPMGTTIQVRPGLYLSLKSGAANSNSAAAVYGFGKSEAVKLFWGNGTILLGSTTTSELGSANSASTIKFKVPPSAKPGTYTVTAVGQTTHGRATQQFTVVTH